MLHPLFCVAKCHGIHYHERYIRLKVLHMAIFHIFTVSPVEVSPHELPRVLYRDYMLSAPTMEQAWAYLSEWHGVSDCAEVWGAERVSSEETFVITGCDTVMSKETELASHEHWRSVQDDNCGAYTRLHSGPTSLQQWQEAHFAAYFAKTSPALSAAMECGMAVSPAANDCANQEAGASTSAEVEPPARVEA